MGSPGNIKKFCGENTAFQAGPPQCSKFQHLYEIFLNKFWERKQYSDPVINVGEVDCGNPANDAANPASVTTKVFSVEMGTYSFLVSYVKPLMSKINSKL